MTGSQHYTDILREGFDEYRRFVNPLIAGRAQLAREPVQMLHAQNGQLIDADGLRYEDFHGTQAFGHRHPAINQAVQNFLSSDAPSWYPSRVSPFSGRLARRLCERSGYEQVWFGCSGSDVVEAALKLARAATRRATILSLTGAYHGCNFGSTALMAAGPFRDPFGPHLPGCQAVTFNDVPALAQAFAHHDVAAVVVEPIQGEGGVRALSGEFIQALCELTQNSGSLLIADEVQTSLGRSGNFLASANWPRQPDVVLIAKALGGGLVPISAMLTRNGVFGKAYGRQFEAAESHNMTFSYNALGAVAALATLELLDDTLIERVKTLGVEFKSWLEESLADSPLFEEVRGAGLMLGVKLKNPGNPWLSFKHFGFPDLQERPAIGPLLATRLYKRGYFCFVCGHDWSILRIQPRLNIEPEKLKAFARACREELDYLNALDE